MGCHCDLSANAQQLLEYLMDDVIIVSIDFEAGRSTRSDFTLGPKNQMGITILDMRQILLSELQCPFGYLHGAGNDANYTLRALLLLAIRGCQNAASALNDSERLMLSSLEVIAQSHLPVLTEERYPGFSEFQANRARKLNDKRRMRDRRSGINGIRKQTCWTFEAKF